VVTSSEPGFTLSGGCFAADGSLSYLAQAGPLDVGPNVVAELAGAPEPGAYVLLGSGLALVAVLKRRHAWPPLA
jgi:hypothetical protein